MMTSGAKDMEAMAAVLGYAQFRGWIVGALGGPLPDPLAMVLRAIRELEQTHDLAAHDAGGLAPDLIAWLQHESGATIRARVRTATAMVSPWLPSRIPLALGDGAWLDAVSDAGARAVPLVVEAPSVFPAAMTAVDQLRARAELARRRRHEDTRPNRPR